jgi:SAM-dependent methyltransferase
VDATEVSSSGLARLRELGARVFSGDVVDAGYEESSFDLVACVEVVEHLPAPLATLKELCRVTRPGGLLLLTTPSFNGLSRRVFGSRWRVVDPEHLAYFTPAALSRALRRAGYRNVTVRARSLDVGAWSTPGGRFEPATTARRRETVNASPSLRLAKRALDAVLGATGLGDSLLARGCK